MNKTEYLDIILTYGVPLLAALFAFIVFMFLVNLSKKESLNTRLKRLAPSKEEAKELVERKHDNEVSAFAATLEPILKGLGFQPAEFRRLNFFKFYRAGVDPIDGPIYYQAYKLVATPIAILIIYLLWDDLAYGELGDQLIAGIGCILAVALSIIGPDLYIKNARLKRELLLIRAFPDALDLLLVCTESGLALDGALARVCKELGSAYPEITDELNKTRLELTLLNDREKALSNLADRTDLVPFRSLVASLVQTERFGTSLTETLRVLADEYRNTRLMLAEQKAGRLPVLMTIPLITCLLPALFLIILGPAIVSVLEVRANSAD